MDSLLVPSSIQRIRSFLIEMCGMKVAPWASTEETLAALHTTLVARHGCGIFWDSLRTLLEKLAHDMKTRASATPGTVIDNEVLDGHHYARLLDEIRQSLDRQEAEATTGSFRQLSAALSAPALSLLLFLGGVASVGCEHSGLKPGSGNPDASLAADTNPPEPDAFVPSDPGKGAPPRYDGGRINPFVDSAPADGPPRIVLPPNPDAAPDHDAATRGADGAAVTIKDIMDSCNLREEVQQKVLACLANVDESWTTGLATTLAGTSCTSVNNDLACMVSNGSDTCPPVSDPKFVVGLTRICQPRLIYLGVSFV
jgi:hypothetical protein